MVGAGSVQLNNVGRVVFGERMTTAVPTQLDSWGVDRVLVLASSSLNRRTDEVRKLVESLGSRSVEVVDGIAPHTPLDTVLGLTAIARATDAQAVITIGGGSLTDAGKAIRMCLANDVGTREDLVDGGSPGGRAPAVPTIRQLSIPTTLSAAEFTGIAGVTDERTHTKVIWRQAAIAPDCVVLDPWVTAHTPGWLFLSTGMRAVDHAVEGFCALEANPYSDAHAVRGLRLLHDGLRAVRADPADVGARMDCQLGAWLASSAISCGVPMGASHGIGYVLGAVHGVPHGYTSCVILPSVLNWNAVANGARQAELVRDAGIGPGELGALIRQLVEDLGLPSTLDAVDVPVESDPDIATRSMSTSWMPFNPRLVESPVSVAEILAAARRA